MCFEPKLSMQNSIDQRVFKSRSDSARLGIHNYAVQK